MTTRINQNSPNFPWDKFIDAINQLHMGSAAQPTYGSFVDVHIRAMSHAGMTWKVHTMNMGGMHTVGTNFLAWHRWMLVRMERRLQAIHPELCIPYWDTMQDPVIPAALDDPNLLAQWGVERNWDPGELPTLADFTTVDSQTIFPSFQRTLELSWHGSVHVAIGGDMNSAASPEDPLFYLHHANIDRAWAKWQRDNENNPDVNPTNPTEILRPTSLFGVPISSVIDIAALGYNYA